MSSLMCATKEGHKQIVSMLLSAGAQVNQQDKVSGVHMGGMGSG